jgi:hypothetical protein
MDYASLIWKAVVWELKMTRYPSPPAYNLEGMDEQDIWRAGFDKGWEKAMEHIWAGGDEHDENCPLCGVDMDYEDRTAGDV